MHEPDDVTPSARRHQEVGRHGGRHRGRLRRRGLGGPLQRSRGGGAGAGSRTDWWTRGGGPLAEGIVYLGGGTPIQTACGFEDSIDDMYRYMMAACGPDPDEAKIARYFNENLRPLRLAGGHVASPSTRPSVRRRRWRRRAPRVSSTRVVGTRTRSCRAPSPRHGGTSPRRRTRHRMAPDAAPRGRRHRFRRRRGGGHPGRPARRRGRARRRGPGAALRRGASPCGRAVDVVLASGSFIGYDDMLRRHCPPLVRGTFKVGTEGDDGRGIRMAQAIGAAVRNMYAGEVSLPITPPRTLIHGILVNGQGSALHQRGHLHGPGGTVQPLYEQDGEVYLIVDEASYEVNWMGLAATWVCETAAQLKSLGLPPGSLQSTVELYNRHAASGDDPLLHKGRAWVRPLVPPIGAIDLRIGPAPYHAVHSRRSGHDRWRCSPATLSGGNTIPGLFAAGAPWPVAAGSASPVAAGIPRGQHAVRPPRRRPAQRRPSRGPESGPQPGRAR